MVSTRCGCWGTQNNEHICQLCVFVFLLILGLNNAIDLVQKQSGLVIHVKGTKLVYLEMQETAEAGMLSYKQEAGETQKIEQQLWV